jgi:hypothetical protein
MRRPTSFRFAATSLVAVLALGLVLVWLTWRLFEQDRAPARQRRAEAQEVGADSAVVHFQKQLARVEQELGAFAEGSRSFSRMAGRCSRALSKQTHPGRVRAGSERSRQAPGSPVRTHG